MAGLLEGFGDFVKTPEGQGLLSAAFGGLAGMQRGAPLNSLGRAGLAGLSGYGGALDRNAKLAEEAQMNKYRQAQIDDFTQRTAKEKMANDAAAAKQSALPGLWTGGQQALAPLMGDDSIGMLPSAGRPAVAPTFDVQKAIRSGFTPDEIAKLDGLRNVGLDKVERTVKGMVNGREVEQQMDAFGRPVGSGMEQYRAPIEVATGAQKLLLNPYTQKPVSSFAMEQSPDSKASNSLGWANFGLSKQRENREAANQDKPVWNESLGGFVDPKKRMVLPAMDASGNVIAGAGPKMTEDQAKASGWLVQAENAFKNMQAAVKTDPGAAKPGFNDALSAIPSLGLTTGAANLMRGDARQQYMQGASSMSEALLRAATGAGVNKDEALQKVRELTPQIGDSDSVIQQKQAAIPLYIESLKLRAGPGAKRVQSIMQGPGSGESDPLGLRKSGGASGGWDSSDPLGLRK